MPIGEHTYLNATAALGTRELRTGGATSWIIHCHAEIRCLRRGLDIYAPGLGAGRRFCATKPEPLLVIQSLMQLRAIS